MGFNNYFRFHVRHDAAVPLLSASLVPWREIKAKRRTQTDWEVYPAGIGEVLDRLRIEYGNPPVYVTENGCASAEVVENGRVHDPERIEYLRDYLTECHHAIERGADLRGYFLWSFLDNFEWADGLSKRFGIVHTDYGTLKRTRKDSARWYQNTIGRNAVQPGDGRAY